MSALIEQLGWALLQFIWQGALIGAIAALGLLALRSSRPQARYALAGAALFACLTWPAMALVLRLLATDGVGATALAGLRDHGSAALAGAPLAWLHANLGTVVLVWSCCAGALSLRMALGLWWIGRAARSPRVNAEWQARLDRLARQCGIHGPVRLRLVDGIASPLTAGWWRPVVLLPSSLLTGLPAPLLEALLAHELAHIQRADYLFNLLQNVVETLLFYHPAVWWLSARMRDERELIADELAASQVGRQRLALALSELEKCQFPPAPLVLGANGGDLKTRITRLLRPAGPAPGWQGALPLLGLSAALIAGCAQLTAYSPPAMPAAGAMAPDIRALIDFSSCAKPVWPAQSLRDGNTGAVALALLVDPQGQVREARVAVSSGFAPLDQAARAALARCSFKPAQAKSIAVPSWAKVTYTWALD